MDVDATYCIGQQPKHRQGRIEIVSPIYVKEVRNIIDTVKKGFCRQFHNLDLSFIGNYRRNLQDYGGHSKAHVSDQK